MLSASKKPSIRLLGTLALLLGAGTAAYWWLRESSPSALQPFSPSVLSSGIVTTATDSHRPQESYSKTGDIRTLPADPSLQEALSHTSRLAFPLRLKTMHALQGATLTAAQADYMRAFVADPAIPEGLTIRHVRALKNDILNVLCLVPGGEAATADVLRTLYADETQDPGLRDYALQHLVSLTERDPSLGWDAHWKAIEGTNPDLAATALLHLSLHLRQSIQAPANNPPTSALQPFSSSALSAQPFSPSVFQSLATAALRLASDTTAPDPARTTAIQVCGQLKLTEARPLANDLARSDRAGMPLRIAAVATLGDLGGDSETRAYLTTLVTGPEKRLRIPAGSALQRFSIN